MDRLCSSATSMHCSSDSGRVSFTWAAADIAVKIKRRTNLNILMAREECGIRSGSSNKRLSCRPVRTHFEPFGYIWTADDAFRPADFVHGAATDAVPTEKSALRCRRPFQPVGDRPPLAGFRR